MTNLYLFTGVGIFLALALTYLYFRHLSAELARQEKENYRLQQQVQQYQQEVKYAAERKKIEGKNRRLSSNNIDERLQQYYRD